MSLPPHLQAKLDAAKQSKNFDVKECDSHKTSGRIFDVHDEIDERTYINRIKPGIDGRYHIIYFTVNLLNGNFYIGKHSTKNINDSYLGSGIILLNAIRKYGKKNFHRDVLWCVKEERLLDTWEKYWIRFFNPNGMSYESGRCYNIAAGGGGSSYKRTKPDPRLGIKLSSERRLKISKALKGKTKEVPGIKNYWNDLPINEVTGRRQGNRNKKVAEYDREGNLIKIWDSCLLLNSFHRINVQNRIKNNSPFKEKIFAYVS